MTPQTLPQFRARLEKLTPESQRLWGKLDATRMVHHLFLVTQISLGETKVTDVSNLFSRTIFPVLVFYVLPWPKGKIKAPDEFTPESPGDLHSQRAALLEKLELFAERSEREPQVRMQHPVFGSCTLRFWQRMHGKHFDYHLRQFGV